MTKKEYNGYYNYETWLTALWIDNDQGLQETVNELARDARDVADLAAQIEEIIRSFNPVQDSASLFGDYVEASLSEVNFDELAADYIACAIENGERDA